MNRNVQIHSNNVINTAFEDGVQKPTNILTKIKRRHKITEMFLKRKKNELLKIIHDFGHFFFAWIDENAHDLA